MIFFTTITIFLLTNDLLDASPCYHLSPLVGGLSLNHTSHNWHQRVVMTCWCLFLLLLQPCRPHQAPMNCKDLLVASPSTMQATPSTNESLRLVGCFFHLSFDHAGHNWHQRVIMTCWCLFSLLLRPRRLQPAPTSHYDLLVPFFSYPSAMLATTSTNKPLWLVGAFFCFSLDHAGHNEHQ